MFAQIIRAKTSDRQAVRAGLDRWLTDVRPGAIGWLGSIAGVTEDGDVFVLARFESEDAAKANSERPEQGAWWASMEKAFDGEATFQDSNDLYIEDAGDKDSAGFVQIVMSQVTDPDRSRQVTEETREARRALRPEILGTVVVGHGDGKFTMAVYFTNEAAARQGEQMEVPPEWHDTMKEMMAITFGVPQFLDLKTPWLDSPK